MAMIIHGGPTVPLRHLRGMANRRNKDMMSDMPATRLKLRLEFDAPLTLGPGKARLLELIEELGSISAAGREMGMSYKRAWSLIEEMNAAFARPAVESSRGGPGGGGARLTETGKEVLVLFRKLEAMLQDEGAAEIAELQRLIADH